MKSYTDIEQSKKLAEILPLESADMYYTPPLVKGHTAYIPHLKRRFPIDWDIEQAIPSWSFAALLDVLTENKICHYDDRYYCQYISEGDEFPIYSTAEYDNPTDACYEMILKLHELNLL